MSTRPSDTELTDVGLRLDQDGAVAVITLARPENRNAQRPSTWRTFARIGEWVASEGMQVVILQAEGPSFSAGMDRAMFTPEGVPGEPSLVALGRTGADDLEGFIIDAQSGFRWWREVDAVSIAAVRGHAMGAGFQLALACDLIVPHPEAVFAMRETSWGLVPDLGGTWPMVARAGYGPALEACATGREITPEELQSWGLALTAQGEPESAARGLAERLLQTPPGAVPALKHLLAEAAGSPASDQWSRERAWQIERITNLAKLMS